MKILLVYTNLNRNIAPPPVALTYLAPSLRKAGNTVQILDLMFSNLPKKDLLAAFDSFKPDAVCFSIRNLDNQHMLKVDNPLPIIKDLVLITKNKGVTTIVGGTAFSTLPVEMLDYLESDYGISGQGEYSLPELINYIEHGGDMHGIPGLVYRTGNGIMSNPPYIGGYSSNPETDWTGFDLKKYKSYLRIPPAAVVIKTGCPFKCIYCDADHLMGDKFILRDIDKIIEEIKIIKKIQNTAWFFLIDPCFNAPIDYAKELLHRIIKENLKIRFLTTLNPIPCCYDNEFFELLIKAGGYFTILGTDSLSQKMLENYKKPFNIDDIYNCSQIANKHGFRFGIELLIGGPGETNDTIKESMALLSKIEYSLFEYTIGVRISPNSQLFRTAQSEGHVNNKSELLFPKFYVSKDIDVEWAEQYIKQCAKKYSSRYKRMLPIILKNLMESLRI